MKLSHKTLKTFMNDGNYYTSKGSSPRNSSGGYKNIDELYHSYNNIDSFVEDIEKYIESRKKLIEAKKIIHTN